MPPPNLPMPPSLLSHARSWLTQMRRKRGFIVAWFRKRKKKKKKKSFRAITQIKKNILHVHVIGYISTMEDKKIKSDLEDKVF
jgi:hypothetical protein